MWSPKQKLYDLTRSLRKARTVSIPEDDDAAVKVLLPMIFQNMHRSLNELLENSTFNINHKFGNVQRTILHIAANTGFSESLTVLLKRDADPNIQDIAGHTPLHISSRNGFKSCVERLLEYGADPNISGTDGGTVLHWASVNGRYEILSLVLCHIKDVNKTDTHGNTALHSAARNGHIKSMEALMAAGSDINKLNDNLQSPLHTACSTGQRSSIELLLSRSPKISRDKDGLTPLALSLKGGYGVAVSLIFSDLVSRNRDNVCKVVSSLVDLAVNRQDFELKRILDCLKSLEDKLIIDMIAEKLCKCVCDISLQLLSVSSCISSLNCKLTKGMGILKGYLDFNQSDTTERPNVCPSLNCLKNFSLLWVSVDNWFNLLLPELQHNEENNQDEPGLLPVMSERLSILVSVMNSTSALAGLKRPSSQQDHSELDFEKFMKKHELVLNKIITRQPDIIFSYFCFLLDNQLLMEPFLPLIKAQDFEKRYKWFYDHLKATASIDHNNVVPLQVNRQDVFTDSCKAVENVDIQKLRRGFSVQFTNEEGMGEGVMREWFNVLLAEIVNPEYGLFSQSADGCTFQPNSQSSVNPDHLNYFRFAGQILGLAMFYRQLVDVHFTRSFYKHLLGVKVNYDDVASIDEEYAKNLQWILDNDITDMGLGLTFQVETDVFGAMREIELLPNGSKISVTQENKDEYVQLVTELRMTGAIRTQIDYFLTGFYQVVPAKYLQLFTETELDFILTGSTDISVDYWMSITQYHDNFDLGHPTVAMFWEAVRRMTNVSRSQLLHFCTGRSRMPPSLFHYHHFKFALTPCASKDPARLPTASTCLNMLKLPPYKNTDEMFEKLIIVAENGKLGYSFT